MRRLIARRHQRSLLSGLLLLALITRALIPAGFMPSSSGPFTMMICHGGMLAQSHSNQPNDPSHFDHCPYGAAPAVGPLSDVATLAPSPPAVARIESAFQSGPAAPRRDRAHPPRAPPQNPQPV
jgi:hypothetical protein